MWLGHPLERGDRGMTRGCLLPTAWAPHSRDHQKGRPCLQPASGAAPLLLWGDHALPVDYVVGGGTAYKVSCPLLGSKENR